MALLSDVRLQGLVHGQVGTVVELLNGAFEVEFSGDERRAYAQFALASHQLSVLHHRPQHIA